MSSFPLGTRKKSSVSSCLCQTNSPFTFTTITSWALSCATVLGDQYSENVASFSVRLILSLCLTRPCGQEQANLEIFGERPQRANWVPFIVVGEGGAAR